MQSSDCHIRRDEPHVEIHQGCHMAQVSPLLLLRLVLPGKRHRDQSRRCGNAAHHGLLQLLQGALGSSRWGILVQSVQELHVAGEKKTDPPDKQQAALLIMLITEYRWLPSAVTELLEK